MTLQFDQEIDRRLTNSIKWAAPLRSLSAEEAASDPLPMWVADMDFRAPATVIQALEKAIRDGIFGYSFRTPGYEEAVCSWQKRRFGWDAKAEWLVQTQSVVTALTLIVKTFSSPGDSILVQPPVYGRFFIDVAENGRQIVEASLSLNKGSYSFDADAFEAAITPKTKIFFLCNPQNPTGNIWSEVDLRRMGEICLRHNILIVADEIHQDLIFNPDRKHIPFASLDEELAKNSIVCTAPSKTFNLAGLKCANVFIVDERMRSEFQRSLARDGLSFVNMLGAVACEAAYRDGEPWLTEMLAYIRENHRHFAAGVHANIRELRVLDTDALYLAWLDCRGLSMAAPDLETFMLTKARVWFDRGSKFGRQGQGFMRVNLACPRSRVDDAMERMKKALPSDR